MNGLSIHRLSAEVISSEPAVGARVDRVLHRLADSALDERRAGWHGLTGHWCVRRLQLLVELDETESDTSLANRWADAIAASVRDLAPDGRWVVHYPNRAQAVHELVSSLAGLVSEHSWAWRQLGLLGAHDPDPVTEPGPALVAVARVEPALVLASLVRTAGQGRLPALHRVLGEVGWVGLSRAVASAGGPAAAVRADGLGAGGRVEGHPQGVGPAPPAASATRRRAAAVVADSALAGAVVAAGVLPSESTLGAWAVLCAAEADPRDPALPAAVAQLLRHRLLSSVAPPRDEDGDPAGLGPGVPHVRVENLDGEPISPADPAGYVAQSASRPGEPSTRELTASHRAPEVSAAAAPLSRGRVIPDPALPAHSGPPSAPAAEGAPRAAGEGQPTAWAGLLFLLASAGPAGVPDELDHDPRLAARLLRWSLHQVAMRLVPVAPTDPAALAFAGLAAARDAGPDGRPPVPAGDPPTDEEDIALAEHAGRWGEQTRALLGAAAVDGFAVPTLWSVARRPGRIVADPGWLEVHLDLDAVDLDIRRAGLDVDPGWVPWLGTVVRYRYV